MKRRLLIPARLAAIRKELLADPTPDSIHGVTALLQTLFPNGHEDLTVHSFIGALAGDDNLAEGLEAWRRRVRRVATERAFEESKPPLVMPFKAAGPPIDPPK